MRVRVLGAVELIHDDGTAQRLSRTRRTLLALLVAARGTPVSTDLLIDELWRGSPPATGVNLLHQRIRDLRRALGEDRRHLQRRANGYALVGADVDQARFEDLVEQGRISVEAGDPERASMLFDAALGLWAGGAYGAVGESPMILTEAARLEELRLVAVESRAAADLALGRQAAVVGDLGPVVQANPLRERLWLLLMTALWHSGRTAEALDAYQRLFLILRDELGVEPSKDVRDLQLRILDGDDPGSGASPTRVEIVPRQLPPVVAAFAGREDQLTKLDQLVEEQLVDDGGRAVVISAIAGTAGIGKTTLALYWAHRAAPRFPDGQVFVNLRGFDPRDALDPLDALGVVLEAFGVERSRQPQEIDGRAGLLRSKLAGKRVLLVLDNARDSEQVRSLLPGSPGCMTLVTSRNRLSGLVAEAGARPMELGLLDDDEAYELLAGRLGNERLLAEPEAVDRIIALCASLPLTLSIVAARAATRPAYALADLADELGESRLDGFGGGRGDLRATFSWSVRHLSEPAARLFRLIGLHPGPTFTVPAAASLAGISRVPARRLLDELSEANLVTEVAPGRFVLHDLLREYAADLAAGERDSLREQAELRMIDHYVFSARAAHSAYDPHQNHLDATEPMRDGVTIEVVGDSGEALAWIAAQLPVMARVIDAAVARGIASDRIVLLIGALERLLDLQGRWIELASLAEAALPGVRREVSQGGDPGGLGVVHRAAGAACGRLGRVDDALDHLGRALDLAMESADLASEGKTLHRLATVATASGDHAGAAAYAARAADVFARAGDPIRAAWTTGRLGLYEALDGAYEAGLRHCEAALMELRRVAPGYRSEGNVVATIGWIHQQLGAADEAAGHFEEAVTKLRAAGDLPGLADALGHLAETRAALGKHEDARCARDECDSILAQLG
ncbi:AfsR/SARP family transcriptional regulator [Nocardioides albus]|uniref:DNA-binding SARP family transcriptional activator n=1 Tax=Nocardioides albus TaxID=1841 RepID=A0A7W5F6Y7_9ACTN|nr:AfsR/SARP family transcriptional regulator [Nocardioides albus]MBB3087282.1 DNA-binding SARP family transcriptional activator [Nocardioides albus]GGU07875.1 SARP family transcriptional regulator [Nocardioides albus]